MALAQKTKKNRLEPENLENDCRAGLSQRRSAGVHLTRQGDFFASSDKRILL